MSKEVKEVVDLHFSRAFPLNQRDSLLLVKIFVFGKGQSRHLFYFILKRK